MENTKIPCACHRPYRWSWTLVLVCSCMSSSRSTNLQAHIFERLTVNICVFYIQATALWTFWKVSANFLFIICKQVCGQCVAINEYILTWLNVSILDTAQFIVQCRNTKSATYWPDFPLFRLTSKFTFVCLSFALKYSWWILLYFLYFICMHFYFYACGKLQSVQLKEMIHVVRCIVSIHSATLQIQHIEISCNDFAE